MNITHFKTIDYHIFWISAKLKPKILNFWLRAGAENLSIVISFEGSKDRPPNFQDFVISVKVIYCNSFKNIYFLTWHHCMIYHRMRCWFYVWQTFWWDMKIMTKKPSVIVCGVGKRLCWISKFLRHRKVSRTSDFVLIEELRNKAKRILAWEFKNKNFNIGFRHIGTFYSSPLGSFIS